MTDETISNPFGASLSATLAEAGLASTLAEAGLASPFAEIVREMSDLARPRALALIDSVHATPPGETPGGAPERALARHAVILDLVNDAVQVCVDKFSVVDPARAHLMKLMGMEDVLASALTSVLLAEVLAIMVDPR